MAAIKQAVSRNSPGYAGIFLVTVPAIAMLLGTFTSGMWSDWLLRRGASLDLARKLPISVGATLVSLLALANFTHSITLVMVIVGVACFMQGLGSTLRRKPCLRVCTSQMRWPKACKGGI